MSGRLTKKLTERQDLMRAKVQILAPESVKEQYRQMIAKADEDMQESE
ncbi:MAG: hypothetical protein ACI4EI_05065 [Muricoprocola sp.]